MKSYIHYFFLLGLFPPVVVTETNKPFPPKHQQLKKNKIQLNNENVIKQLQSKDFRKHVDKLTSPPPHLFKKNTDGMSPDLTETEKQKEAEFMSIMQQQFQRHHLVQQLNNPEVSILEKVTLINTFRFLINKQGFFSSLSSPSSSIQPFNLANGGLYNDFSS
jgi:hypothetical protein